MNDVLEQNRLEQERRDNLRIVALQQAVHLACNNSLWDGAAINTMAEQFLSFLISADEQRAA